MAVPVTDLQATPAQRAAEIEVELLLDGLFQLYGFDFRGYERATIRSKFVEFMRKRGLKTFSALQDCVFHDGLAAEALLLSLAKRRTSLFDNAAAFRSLREMIGPLLRSYPLPRIWVAECTSPEEVFSVAILLEEASLLHKAEIYVTCSNPALLHQAREGRFDRERLPEYEKNYLEGGGTADFADYWIMQDGKGEFRPELVRKVTWCESNLITDTSFNEFQMIICRNQLVEFGAVLRRRILALLEGSLVQFGLLHTDVVDELHAVPFSLNYKALSVQHGIYQRN